MDCIVIDDEPIARRGIEKMINDISSLCLLAQFDNAVAAAHFMESRSVDLIFLDIQMPGVNGLEFSRRIPRETLVIFTTAFAEYALDSYEVDAVDYLVKPIHPERFNRAVEKAASYLGLLMAGRSGAKIQQVGTDYIFVKAERRFFRVNFREILFIEGLKDYVVIHTTKQRIITLMNLKGIHELLPIDQFLRVNRSYIVNKECVHSFSNNDVFIADQEISIGNTYRDEFFKQMMGY